MLSSSEKEFEQPALAQHSPEFPESEEGNEKGKDHQIPDEHLIRAHTDPLVERQSFNRFFENVKGTSKPNRNAFQRVEIINGWSSCRRPSRAYSPIIMILARTNALIIANPYLKKEFETLSSCNISML